MFASVASFTTERDSTHRNGSGVTEREQCDDGGANYLAVAPGVVSGYDWTVSTNPMLPKNGIEAVTVAGGELDSGHRGLHCVTCPIRRDPA